MENLKEKLMNKRWNVSVHFMVNRERVLDLHRTLLESKKSSGSFDTSITSIDEIVDKATKAKSFAVHVTTTFNGFVLKEGNAPVFADNRFKHLVINTEEVDGKYVNTLNGTMDVILNLNFADYTNKYARYEATFTSESTMLFDENNKIVLELPSILLYGTKFEVDGDYETVTVPCMGGVDAIIHPGKF